MDKSFKIGLLLLAIFSIMRKLLFFILIGYGVIFGFCLIHAFYGGLDIRASLPAIIITEPGSSLISIPYEYLTEGYVTDEYWDKLSAAGVVIVIASGIINISIVWGIARLFRNSN